ncbi:MAG: hypothetical protein ABIH08_08085 [Candidatus Omnitrophota bacterium]
MPEDYLPEERLLDVINAGKNKDEAGKEKAGKESIFSIANFFKVFNLKKFKFKINSEVFTVGLRQKNITLTIKVLKVVAAALLLIVSFDLFFNKQYSISKVLPRQAAAKLTQAETPNIVYLKPSDYYLNRVQYRDVFSKYIQEAPKAKETSLNVAIEPEKTNQAIKEKVNNFKLVGIAWAEAEDDLAGVIEAMIEDTTEGKAYFLEEREYIGKTEVFIKKIYRDRVILGYQEQELEFFGGF